MFLKFPKTNIAMASDIKIFKPLYNNIGVGGNLLCFMDLEKLIQKHPNVSRDELEKIRETSHFLNYKEHSFVKVVQLCHLRREKEKTNGRESVKAGPLVQVLSAHVLPSDKLIDQNKPLATYGRIYAEYRDTTSGETIVHDLYSRKWDDAQVLGPSGGPLTLIGPDYSCWPFGDCMSLNNNTRLVVNLFTGVEGNNLFAEKQFFCTEEDMTTDLEKVKIEYVHGGLGSLALRYIAMPFAVYGNVEVVFIHKKLDKENLHSQSLNVKGRIVARYGNNPCRSEFTLFEKQCDNEFERVENDPRSGISSMRLSRCWVGVPAYSSLILDVDLSEFGTGRKILKETVELRVENERESGDKFIVDDNILICVKVGWVSSMPQGKQESYGMELDDEDEDESSDDEMSGDDEQMDEVSCVPVASSSNLSRPWVLHAHQYIPLSASFVEIFSVFIGRENYKALQVYGSIQRNQDDPAQPATDGFIALCRSLVIVPEHSSIIIEATLANGLSDEVYFKELEFEIGKGGTIHNKSIMEANGFSIEIYVKWDVKM
ncbi:hypothetical protein PHJA_000977200 [Phtheirospermum japonicum]|uniref:DUF6598 domain-containing protein n=1 Tax=Phtheirospermum japonicum TaxID=374723 RepID=A0A830BYJ0_9LAMI|nr:hypothetical protein PHJA_000977200 [Phtheirospermum japonicum]